MKNEQINKTNESAGCIYTYIWKYICIIYKIIIIKKEVMNLRELGKTEVTGIIGENRNNNNIWGKQELE